MGSLYFITEKNLCAPGLLINIIYGAQRKQVTEMTQVGYHHGC